MVEREDAVAHTEAFLGNPQEIADRQSFAAQLPVQVAEAALDGVDVVLGDQMLQMVDASGHVCHQPRARARDPYPCRQSNSWQALSKMDRRSSRCLSVSQRA